MKKNKDYSYPDVEDDNIQKKIFKKREFFINKIPKRDILKTDKEIKNYREENCNIGSSEFKLKEAQKIISNLMRPDTPYNGILLMYGTGTETASAIAIAEQFKTK